MGSGPQLIMACKIFEKSLYHKLVFALIISKCRQAFSKEPRELNNWFSDDELFLSFFGNFSLNFKLDI